MVFSLMQSTNNDVGGRSATPSLRRSPLRFLYWIVFALAVWCSNLIWSLISLNLQRMKVLVSYHDQAAEQRLINRPYSNDKPIWANFKARGKICQSPSPAVPLDSQRGFTPPQRLAVAGIQGIGPTSGRARDCDILESGGSAGNSSPEKQWAEEYRQKSKRSCHYFGVRGKATFKIQRPK